MRAISFQKPFARMAASYNKAFQVTDPPARRITSGKRIRALLL